MRRSRFSSEPPAAVEASAAPVEAPSRKRNRWDDVDAPKAALVSAALPAAPPARPASPPPRPQEPGAWDDVAVTDTAPALAPTATAAACAPRPLGGLRLAPARLPTRGAPAASIFTAAVDNEDVVEATAPSRRPNASAVSVGTAADAADDLDAFVSALAPAPVPAPLDFIGVVLPPRPPPAVAALTWAEIQVELARESAAMRARDDGGVSSDAMPVDGDAAGAAPDAPRDDDDAYHDAFMSLLATETGGDAASFGGVVVKQNNVAQGPAAEVPRAGSGGDAGDGAMAVAGGGRMTPAVVGAGASSGVLAEKAVAETGTSARDGDAVSEGAALQSTAQDREYDEDAALYAGVEWGEEEASALEIMRAKLEKKELTPVDHDKVDYIPIRKNLYREHPAVSAQSEDDIATLREDLEIKLRGRAPIPRPVSTWEESGLPDQLLAALAGRSFAAPFAIQRQALPVIMSGRDVLGVARTGSGKTLAYLLPMFRTIIDQPPLGDGEGPIGLVLAPSRELVVQIHAEARRFGRALNYQCTAIYGGAPVAEQIRALRRGGEVVIATPGRLIDMLTLNQGRLVSFSRVSYVVLDEADRMLDMGFEPQISKILTVVRPDRQLVMFSATFPDHIEALARRTLRSAPVEIVVGGRSKAAPHIVQSVEVRDASTKFPRLLQLLGEWYERGGVLVFVDTQESADILWAELHRRGYPAGVLHGGKDQDDRDQTLADFKAGIRTLLVATSIAGRGLDVKGLLLVVNYDAPNHLEDYVHRVGRTGRAGAPGTAVTFITPSESQHAPDLVRVLRDALQEAAISPELRALAATHAAAVKAGTARKRASGFTNAKGGFKFDASERSAAEEARLNARGAVDGDAALEAVASSRADESEAFPVGLDGGGGAGAGGGGSSGGGGGGGGAIESSTAIASAGAGAEGGTPQVSLSTEALRARSLAMAKAVQLGLSDAAKAPPAQLHAGASAAAALAIASIQRNLSAAGGNIASAMAAGATGTLVVSADGHAVDELDINEYPQQARFITMKESVRRVEEWSGASVTSRGVYVPPGRMPAPGERRLHLIIAGPNEVSVKKAKAELRRVLEEETLRVGANAVISQMAAGGKYNV